MSVQIIPVYYNANGEPFKDSEYTQPYSGVYGTFTGGHNSIEFRFYFNSFLNVANNTVLSSAKKPDGSLYALVLTSPTSEGYYSFPLSGDYVNQVGKLVIALKVYAGTINLVDNNDNTYTLSVTDESIVVNDIFSFVINYAPNADINVPNFTTSQYQNILFAISSKLDKSSYTLIRRVNVLPADISNDALGTIYLVAPQTTNDDWKYYRVENINNVKTSVLYARVLGSTEQEALISWYEGVKSGTVIVPKAQYDKNGDEINTTYETINNVKALIERKSTNYTDLPTAISNTTVGQISYITYGSSQTKAIIYKDSSNTAYTLNSNLVLHYTLSNSVWINDKSFLANSDLLSSIDNSANAVKSSAVKTFVEQIQTNLQNQINAIKSASDVFSVVATKAILNSINWISEGITDKDIVKVLVDESENKDISYYQWADITSTFTLIGSIPQPVGKITYDIVYDLKTLISMLYSNDKMIIGTACFAETSDYSEVTVLCCSVDKKDYAVITEDGYLKTANIVSPYASDNVSISDQYLLRDNEIWRALSGSSVSDNADFVFRSTGGSLDVGTLKTVNSIRGNTLAWNQLANIVNPTTTISGITITNNGDGSWTLNGTATADIAFVFSSLSKAIIKGHKYLIKGTLQGGGSNIYGRFIDNIGMIFEDKIWTSNVNCDYTDKFRIYPGVVLNNVKIVPQIFNLTQMYGNNNRIPSIILNGTTENVGTRTTTVSGVACFNRFFPKSYYAYNAGSLVSVDNLTGFIDIGTNAFNGNQGDYIRTIANQSYILTGSNGTIKEYDFGKNLIKTTSVNDNGHITLSSNTQYITLTGLTTISGVMLRLYWTKEPSDIDYTAYNEYSLNLPENAQNLTLRGIYGIDGDTYNLESGKKTTKYGIVDLGTLSWGYASGRFYSWDLQNLAKPTATNLVIANSICQKYISTTSTNVDGRVLDKSVAIRYDSALLIYDTAYTNATDFTTAMSGVYLVYELATSTEESLQFPPSSIMNISDLGTEGVIYTSDSDDVIVPANITSSYVANLIDKIRRLPEPEDLEQALLDIADLQSNHVIPVLPTANGNYILNINNNVSIWENIANIYYKETVGNGSSISFSINHNLNSKDIFVTAYKLSSGETVETSVVRNSNNQITVSVVNAPQTNDLVILIQKLLYM